MGVSGPSLLIESTDSVITNMYIEDHYIIYSHRFTRKEFATAASLWIALSSTTMHLFRVRRNLLQNLVGKNLTSVTKSLVFLSQTTQLLGLPIP